MTSLDCGLCSHLLFSLLIHLLVAVPSIKLLLDLILPTDGNEILHFLYSPVLFPALDSRERWARVFHGV